MSCRGCLNGIVGLAKAALNLAPVTPEQLAQRRDECRRCDRAGKSAKPRFAEFGGLTSLSKCRECGCYIAAKTRVASESCPLGKWPAFTATESRTPTTAAPSAAPSDLQSPS